MRLFIAVELPKNVKRELYRASQSLRELDRGNGRFVTIDSMHITLSFIGESENIVGAVDAMKTAVAGIKPFPLHLGEFDCFRKGEDDKCTAIVNVLGSLDELNACHESLISKLRDEGFKTDYKKYVPHITLARNVELDEKGIAAMKSIPPLNASMQASGITLFESVRGKFGMTYSSLHKELF